MGLSKSKIKKLTILVLLERSSNVEFNYLKIFVIRGHKRSLEVNKGQMEVKNQKWKKVNNMGIDGKVFNCRNQLFDIFCHKRSLGVNGGQ